MFTVLFDRVLFGAKSHCFEVNHLNRIQTGCGFKKMLYFLSFVGQCGTNWWRGGNDFLATWFTSPRIYFFSCVILFFLRVLVG